MAKIIDYMRKKLGMGKYRFTGFKRGMLYSYTYDPKYKSTLAFYDSQPLIIFLDNAPGGWYGLNIHFLPSKMREKLFREMNRKIKNNTDMQIRTEIWRRMSVIKGFEKALIRRYLKSQMKSKIYPIPIKDWADFKNLPTEKFYGLNSNQIFKLTLAGK